jgi:hypothetical protein
MLLRRTSSTKPTSPRSTHLRGRGEAYVPHLLSAVACNTFLTFCGRFNCLMPTLQQVGGMVLVAMGVLLFTGYLTALNAYAIALTPEWLWRWL